MRQTFMNVLRFLDRRCKAHLPARLYNHLRAHAIGILIERYHRQKANQGDIDFVPSLPAVPPVFVSCDGRETSGVSITGAGLIDATSFTAERVAGCDVVLCCAFTGRHRVLRQAIEESLSANASVRWMLVGSTMEDLHFIKVLARTTGRVAGFAYENRPLGRKWQICLSLAHHHYEAELFGITGSDDIVSAKLIDYVIGRYRANIATQVDSKFLPSLFATLEWLVVVTDDTHSAAPQILRCCYHCDSALQPLGAGRFYTRAFLEEADFRIFNSKLNRLLDDQGYFLICKRRKLIDYYTIEGAALVSVKGKWAQLNDVDGLLNAPQLKLREYSFEGYDLLRRSVQGSTLKYLFKSGRIEPQMNFSSPPLGIADAGAVR